MTAKRTAHIWLLATLLAVLLPAGAQAQGWTPAMVGIRFGWLDRSSASVLGAQLHLPVIPSGRLELVPNADITFLHGLKEYEYSLDAVYISGGRRGGLMVGGGPAARNSIYDESVGRETRRGWDLVLGLKTMPGRGVPFGFQLEERWMFMRLPLNPRVLSVGLNFPLWGWGQFGG